MESPSESQRVPDLDFELELQLRDYIDAHRTRILAHCRRFTHDSHDAEDALQQTFIALARHLRVMRDRGERLERPLAWLLQVSKRCAIDTVRARKRRRNHERAAAGQRDEVTVNATSTVEARLAVQQALDTLPAPYRTPLILFYFGGQDLEAIAKQLSMTTNAVSVKLHRGRAMLEKRLRARGVFVPAIGLPLLLAEAVRMQVIEGAGSSLMIGGATTLHASNSILCGNSLAALVSPDPILPAATLFQFPLHGRLAFALATMIVATAVSVGGSGVVNDLRRYTPKWEWKFDLLDAVQDYLSDLPRLVAIQEEAPADPAADSMESRWAVAGRPMPARVDPPAATASSRMPDFFAVQTPRSSQVALPQARHAPAHAATRLAPKPAEQFKLADPYVPPGAGVSPVAAAASRAGSRSPGEIASEMIETEPANTIAAPSYTADSTVISAFTTSSGTVYGSGAGTVRTGWSGQNLAFAADRDAISPVLVSDEQFVSNDLAVTPIRPVITVPRAPTAPVITPEPGAGLLVLAATALVRRRRRKPA